LPIARGDYIYDNRNRGTFTKGSDYLFVLDEGFRAIPPDVERAATLLIDDLKCGKLDYYQKYVTSYNTDQYRIQFDKKMLEGTGNLIVDKILDKYMKSITKVGVL
jgi:ribosome biogenesis GTPase A